jgi:IS605 OrfB family transposase
VDFGIKHPAVTSDNRFIARKKKGHWKAHEKGLLGLRTRLQSKGTKSAKRHLHALSGRLRRFRLDCDRVIAKEILAPLQPGDTVVLEDLTGLKERCGEKKRRKANKAHRGRLGRWAYARRAAAVEARAATNGIYAVRVMPQYTSRRCPFCGRLAKRIGQGLLVCECGRQLNADLAASRNIEFLWCSANDAAPGPSVNRPIVGGVHANAHPAYKLRALARSS